MISFDEGVIMEIKLMGIHRIFPIFPFSEIQHLGFSRYL